MGAFHPHDCAPWSDDLDIGRAADLGRAAVHAELASTRRLPTAET